MAATVSLATQPTPPAIQLRAAGRMSAWLASEPLEGIVRLLQAPAAVPRHPAAALALLSPSATTPMSRLEELHAAIDRAGRGAAPPALPTLDLTLDGADVVLPGRKPVSHALRLSLGRVQVRNSGSETGKPRVTGAVESVGVVLESSLAVADAADGPVQMLHLSCISVEATCAAIQSQPTTPRRGQQPQPQELGPQGTADCLPSFGGQGKTAAPAPPAQWGVVVSLPAIQARLSLDHLLETLWIVGGGPGAGLANEVRRRSEVYSHSTPVKPNESFCPCPRISTTTASAPAAPARQLPQPPPAALPPRRLGPLAGATPAEPAPRLPVHRPHAAARLALRRTACNWTARRGGVQALGGDGSWWQLGCLDRTVRHQPAPRDRGAPH